MAASPSAVRMVDTLKKVLLKKVLRDEVMPFSVRQKSGRDGRGTSRSHPAARVAQTGSARSRRSSRALSGFAETSPGSCAGFRRARFLVRLRRNPAQEPGE